MTNELSQKFYGGGLLCWRCHSLKNPLWDWEVKFTRKLYKRYTINLIIICKEFASQVISNKMRDNGIMITISYQLETK